MLAYMRFIGEARCKPVLDKEFSREDLFEGELIESYSPSSGIYLVHFKRFNSHDRILKDAISNAIRTLKMSPEYVDRPAPVEEFEVPVFYGNKGLSDKVRVSFGKHSYDRGDKEIGMPFTHISPTITLGSHSSLGGIEALAEKLKLPNPFKRLIH